MIHNIFEFGDKEAKDMMTHRKNIMCARRHQNVLRQALVDFLGGEQLLQVSRCYMDDIDDIIGVLHIKEALALSLEDGGLRTRRSLRIQKGLIREADFIPETRNI